MRSLLAPVLIVLIGLTPVASVTPTEAAKHVGERVQVCGTVASANFARASRGSPTFLNLDKPYPKHIFTIVIWGEARPRFTYEPESLEGKRVCATGTVKVYRGKPEMVVSEPNEVRVVQ
ncbi:MAG: DNA-binding protein [Deltaproteobacteria bacterium]|nr:DNA-binding protein [Deltaproteobacteria bacterium]